MIRRVTYPIAAPDTTTGDNWARFATCAQDAYRGQSEELWNAHAGERAKLAEAVRLCHTCPVRQRCLDEAIREEGNVGKERRFGIRGGLLPTQRRRLYDELERRRKEAAA
jgi:hypothetical protein